MENTLSSGTALTVNLGGRLLKILQSTSSLRWPFTGYQFTTFVPFAGEPFFFSYQWRNAAFRQTYESFHQASIKLSSNLMCCAFACWETWRNLARGRRQSQIGRKMCICLILSSVRYYHLVECKAFINLSKVFKVKFQFQYITRKRKSVRVGCSWCLTLIPGVQVNS